MKTERVNKLMAAQVANLWRHVQQLEKQMRKLLRSKRTAKILGVLVFSLLASPAFATLTVGVHDSKQVNSNVTTTTNAKTTTTGSAIVVGIQYQAGDTVQTITDTYNNTWLEIQSNFAHAFGIQSRAWYCARCTGGASHTVTVTVAGGISQAIYLQEIKASAGNGVFLDQSGRQADTSSPFTSQQVTTTTADEFLWSMGVSGAASAGDTWTAGASFTMQENQTDGGGGVAGAMGTRIVTSTGQYNSSWTAAVATTSGIWIATFSETPTAAGTLLTDTNVRTEPALPTMGARGSKVTDPVFGTTILRVTDASDGAWAQTPYSSYPSVNVNSSRVMATVAPISNNKFWTLNKDTLTVGSGSLANSSANVIYQHFFLWSGTNPDLVYGAGNPSALGVDAAKLYSYNVATGVTTLVKDFSGLTLAGIAPHSGARLYQFQKDKADNVFSFNIQDSSGVDKGFLYWKRSTDTVLLNVTNANTNETYVDKSGAYGYVIIDPYPRVDVYNLATQTLIATLSTNGFSHNGAGTGTVFTMRDNANAMSAGNLATPNTFTNRMAGYFTTATQNQHSSFNSTDESYGLVSRFSKTGGPVLDAFDNEILLVSTSGNAVKRIAHHRSITNAYEASPFANISPDGQIIAFTSTWGTNLSSGGRRDLYLVKIPAPDSTPPILTAAFPLIDLPAGSTEAFPSVIADEPATVKYGTSDVAYASLPNTATAASLTHTGHITGLTNGSTTVVYFRGQDTALNPDLSSTTVTVHVASSTADTTPPGNVTLSGAVVDATHLSYSWPAATGGDVAGYQLYLCLNPCTPDESSSGITTTDLSAIIPSLLAGTSYDVRARAFDTSANFSSSYSNKVTLTTSAAADLTPPTPPTNIRVAQLVNKTAKLAFTSGTDAGSGVGVHTIEQCSGSLTCSDFLFRTASSNALIEVRGLSASTIYCWRCYDTDLLGNVGVAGDVVCGTTTALGVDELRPLITQPRAPRVP